MPDVRTWRWARVFRIHRLLFSTSENPVRATAAKNCTPATPNRSWAGRNTSTFWRPSVLDRVFADHRWTEGKPHWTYVHPEYLSKGFAEAREAAGLYADMKPAKRPTFHEIRGLGAR